MQVEDDLNFWELEDDIKFFPKWKTTSIFWNMEDNLNQKVEDFHNILESGRRLEYFSPNERRPHFLKNGRQPQLIGK